MIPGSGRSAGVRDRLPTPVFLGFPCGSADQESTYNAGDPGSFSGSGRAPREGIGYPLQYSWASLVAQLIKKNPPAMQETWIRSLSWEDPQWRARQPTPVFLPGDSPRTDEPGSLQSMRLQRVGHDQATKHIHNVTGTAFPFFRCGLHFCCFSQNECF